MALSLYDIRCIANNCLDNKKVNIPQFSSNLPGFDWAQAFLKRHKNTLAQRLEVNMSAHITINSLHLAKDKNIHLLFSPPNATHLL